MALRVNSKSFRCTNEVLDIIAAAPGETFADRIEFMVTDFLNKKNDRLRQLAQADKIIKAKREEMDKLNERLSGLRSIGRNFDNMLNDILKVKEDCDTYLAAAASGSADQGDDCVLHLDNLEVC
jgi:DNA repair ATPase RecN